jgi:hypothetical protein
VTTITHFIGLQAEIDMNDSAIILPKGQRLDLVIAQKAQSPTHSVREIALLYDISTEDLGDPVGRTSH